jgi:hypothetical protein
MQVALDAERMAQQALAGGSGGDVLPASVLTEYAKDVSALHTRVGEFEDWRAGFLGADGPKGVSKIAEDIDTLRGNLAHITEQLAAMPDCAAGDSQLKPQRLFDATLAVDKRVRDLEEWQAAQLDEDQIGGVDALAERLAEVEAELRLLRAHPSTQVTGRPAAPHVLGLIAELQKRVYAIGKGREFKSENQRGDTTQRYNFRGIDDAQDAIGIAQREIGLIGPAVTVIDKTVSTTEVNKGSYTQVWTTVSVTCRYTFQSPVDGSEWSTEGCGMGRDPGDKAESKALAGAFKYALFHGLNITVRGVFTDAETEDPRIEREHEQSDGRTYGHGRPPNRHGSDAEAEAAFERALHNPTPENVQQSIAAQQAASADTRSPEQLSADAYAAIKRVGGVAEAAKVWNYAAAAGCLSMFVEGAQLGQHMLAAIRMLPGGNALQLPGMEHFQ